MTESQKHDHFHALLIQNRWKSRILLVTLILVVISTCFCNCISSLLWYLKRKGNQRPGSCSISIHVKVAGCLTP